MATYNMSYSSVVSAVPFLVIIIVFALARTADQIQWCPLQISHLCGILHLLTYKLSHVEQVIMSLPNNMYCFEYMIYQLSKSLVDGDVIYLRLPKKKRPSFFGLRASS
jgi:hypothetical protein